MINWAHWHNEPYLVGGLVLLGWLYALALGPFRAHLGGGASAAGLDGRHRACFYGGLLVFYLAVGSPLDQVGEQFLFSAHMLQHLLLVYPAAALVLLGVPEWLADRLLRPVFLAKVAAVFTRPAVALCTYATVTGAWHLPDLYDLALRNKGVHVAEHLCFFGTALLLWWPILSPTKRFPALPNGVQILYWVAMMIVTTPLFAYITFSREVLYPTYEYAPRICGLSAKEDQVLAGAGMKIVGILMAVGMSGVAFWRMNSEEVEASSRLARSRG